MSPPLPFGGTHRGGEEEEGCPFYSSLTIWRSIERRAWKKWLLCDRSSQIGGMLICISLAMRPARYKAGRRPTAGRSVERYRASRSDSQPEPRREQRTPIHREGGRKEEGEIWAAHTRARALSPVLYLKENSIFLPSFLGLESFKKGGERPHHHHHHLQLGADCKESGDQQPPGGSEDGCLTSTTSAAIPARQPPPFRLKPPGIISSLSPEGFPDR